MDIGGNVSATNTQKIVYVVSAMLTVSTNGPCTLIPNYNGALLQIGKTYSIAVLTGPGFSFTNWTGGTSLPLTFVTNGTTVQFVMVSNLMLQANLVDLSRPTLAIATPTAGQHMSNALAFVTGTAGETNWVIAGVWCQLNSNSWSLATTTNGWTNWVTLLSLSAGTNTIKAYAIDPGGNVSFTNSLSVLSSNTFKLLLNLTNSRPLTSSGLNFSLQVSPGINGTIQVSTNLADWLTLTNFVGTNPTINLHDSSATNFNQRFYRAQTP